MLLVAVAVCHPLLLKGGERLILKGIFDDYIQENSLYPLSLTREGKANVTGLDELYSLMDAYRNKWNEYIEAEPLYETQLVRFSYFRGENSLDNSVVDASLWNGKELDEHIRIVKGQSYVTAEVKQLENNTVYPCIVSEAVADYYKLVIDEVISYNNMLDSENKPLLIYVAGIYRNDDSTDAYFADTPIFDQKSIWLDDRDMNAIIAAFNISEMYFYQNAVLNHNRITPDNAERYLNYLNQFAKSDRLLSSPAISLFKTYSRKAHSAHMILWVIELPCMILLMMFIYMVADRIVASEETEIAVWRSRGTKRMQIVGMYLKQTFVLCIPALGAGMALGYAMCIAAAKTDSFMSFTDKSVDSYSFEAEAVIYGLAACIIATVCIIIPAYRKSVATVVGLKAVGKYGNKNNLVEKLLLDIILVGLSVYLLVNYNRQSDSMVESIINGDALDPLIFINVNIFTLGCGFLVIRLCRYLINLIYFFGKNHLSATAYSAVLQTKRTYKNARILSLFLIMTISCGIFDAGLAETLRNANEERVKYDIGCDLKFHEKWTEKHLTSTGIRYAILNEPDYGRYEELIEEGFFKQATRVYTDSTITASRKRTSLDNCTYMAIYTDEFGRTARLMPGINEEHWFYALNALAAEENGVIISENLAEKLNVSVGDSIILTQYAQGNVKSADNSTVVAIVKAFPGYDRYVYRENNEGGLNEIEKYLLVENYAVAVRKYGMLPYDIWCSLGEGKTAEDISDELMRRDIKTNMFISLERETEKAKSEAIIQIINAEFTISFIICSVITIIGFMIYWIVSIKSRELLFGVYRAMGMHIKAVGKIIFTEVFFCSVLPAVCSVGIGLLCSELFSELISHVCLPKKHNIPLELISPLDRLKIAGIVVVGVFVLVYLVLRLIIRRMNITQAIKLGED